MASSLSESTHSNSSETIDDIFSSSSGSLSAFEDFDAESDHNQLTKHVNNVNKNKYPESNISVQVNSYCNTLSTKSSSSIKSNLSSSFSIFNFSKSADLPDLAELQKETDYLLYKVSKYLKHNCTKSTSANVVAVDSNKNPTNHKFNMLNWYKSWKNKKRECYINSLFSQLTPKLKLCSNSYIQLIDNKYLAKSALLYQSNQYLNKISKCVNFYLSKAEKYDELYNECFDICVNLKNELLEIKFSIEFNQEVKALRCRRYSLSSDYSNTSSNGKNEHHCASIATLGSSSTLSNSSLNEVNVNYHGQLHDQNKSLHHNSHHKHGMHHSHHHHNTINHSNSNQDVYHGCKARTSPYKCTRSIKNKRCAETEAISSGERPCDFAGCSKLSSGESFAHDKTVQCTGEKFSLSNPDVVCLLPSSNSDDTCGTKSAGSHFDEKSNIDCKYSDLAVVPDSTNPDEEPISRATEPARWHGYLVNDVHHMSAISKSLRGNTVIMGSSTSIKENFLNGGCNVEQSTNNSGNKNISISEISNSISLDTATDLISESIEVDQFGNIKNSRSPNKPKTAESSNGVKPVCVSDGSIHKSDDSLNESGSNQLHRLSCAGLGGFVTSSNCISSELDLLFSDVVKLLMKSSNTSISKLNDSHGNRLSIRVRSVSNLSSSNELNKSCNLPSYKSDVKEKLIQSKPPFRNLFSCCHNELNAYKTLDKKLDTSVHSDKNSKSYALNGKVDVTKCKTEFDDDDEMFECMVNQLTKLNRIKRKYNKLIYILKKSRDDAIVSKRKYKVLFKDLYVSYCITLRFNNTYSYKCEFISFSTCCRLKKIMEVIKILLH